MNNFLLLTFCCSSDSCFHVLAQKNQGFSGSFSGAPQFQGFSGFGGHPDLVYINT